MTNEEFLTVIEEMIKNIENLPPAAMAQFLTHYDLLQILFLLRAFALDKA